MTQHPVEKRSCPCKELPLSLSSFTAAEFGDIHALAKIGPSVVHRQDSAGYTPLHLAAQNGHTAVTALLIQMDASIVDSQSCGATPLHRASYSGAVTTMKLLLDAGASLTARDVSFGDSMTPLHKAVAGGRPLAVRLLLDAWSLKPIGDANRGLLLLDARGYTPLDVAKEMQKIGDRDRVRRWDAIARGPPDWDSCVLLLQRALGVEPNNTLSSIPTVLPPPHLWSSSSCNDCYDGSSGQCRTKSWEAAFQAALLQSVDCSTTRTATGIVTQDSTLKGLVNPSALASSREQTRPNEILTGNTTCNDAKSQAGKECTNCGVWTIVFFSVNNKLLCKSCSKTARRMRFLNATGNVMS